MFAAGTPALALEFDCIDELVQNGKNGYTFKNASELNRHLTRLLLNEPELQELREGVKNFRDETWESNWETIFLPVVS
jgi:beta-1,4-mannosyltransferase